MDKEFNLFGTHIVVGDTSIMQLEKIINDLNPTTIFILLDANTKKKCLPILLNLNPVISASHIIELPCGENTKSIDILHAISLKLMNLNIDRHSVIINLGGGSICDFGGFLSSVIKRGIKFINIPTTLMAQIDASIGGKVALNLNKIKNQIGLFSKPEAIIVYPPYISSLSDDDFLSAISEVFKYGIIYDVDFWNEISDLKFHKDLNLQSIISKCISIKIDIVNLDYFDFQERRILNFGHSISHALESCFAHKTKSLSHGYALAVGIICEAYISTCKYNFPSKKLDHITETIIANFPPINLQELDYDIFLNHLKLDKKNQLGIYNFTLIKDIGQPIFNSKVSDNDIIKSLDFYKKNVASNLK